MKGLLIKDLKLLKLQKRFMFIILLIGISQSIIMGNYNFLISFIAFTFSLLTFSTISYDDYNNGYIFLFTLPISRKTYVLEKYLLTLIISSCSVLLGFILSLLPFASHQISSFSETLFIAVTIFLICLITMSFSIPFQFKFGSDKAKIATFAFVAFFISVIVLISPYIDLSAIENMSAVSLIFFLAGITIISNILSIVISIKIIERKIF